MCICLNCDRITKCNIYNVIGQKHEEVSFIKLSDFYPQSPVLQTLFTYFDELEFLLEWDINGCLSYDNNPGKWIFKIPEIKILEISYLNYDFFFEFEKE
uniref:hypothetical protein n=1 Tax=Dictyotopsis propagulifera TaxID=670095 RepID=UPI002E77E849|nr:hypothetical protein V2485_pgp065 [Dictyotopsis propagulifera]WAM63192.1 hypothetical protein [Dictyotopsis propagulifera]